MKYPRLFGGSDFFKTYPFALPNIVSSLFFLIGLTTGFLFLKETLETRKSRLDSGRKLGEQILRPFARKQTPAWQLEGEESAALLRPSRSSSSAKASDITRAGDGNVKLQTPPTYKEVSLQHIPLCCSLLINHCIWERNMMAVSRAESLMPSCEPSLDGSIGRPKINMLRMTADILPAVESKFVDIHPAGSPRGRVRSASASFHALSTSSNQCFQPRGQITIQICWWLRNRCTLNNL